MEAKKSKHGRILALQPLKAKRASQEKWGEEVMALGFCILPSLLLKAQARLGLNAKHLAVLVHLADFWWAAERKPRPSKGRIAARLGLSPRQVQRYIAEIEAMGLLQRIERTAPNRGKRANTYDLSGLVVRLKRLAAEFREIDQQAKEARRRASRPGLKDRTAAAAD